jgi:hypothetical protein
MKWQLDLGGFPKTNCETQFNEAGSLWRTARHASPVVLHWLFLQAVATHPEREGFGRTQKETGSLFTGEWYCGPSLGQ